MNKMLSSFSIVAFTAAMLFGIPAAQAAGPALTSPVAALVVAPAGLAAESPAQNYGQEPWATAPSEWQGARRQGFHDGIEGARKDAENHRPPDVNNRDEYRNPDLPRRDWRAYREGFQRGYRVGIQHLMNQAVAPAQVYGQGSWENPPNQYRGAERKGFQDGLEGARQDAKNGRTPNVNNRDEYRKPDVPRREWGAYRQGFQQGYQTGVEHLMHHGYHHDHD